MPTFVFNVSVAGKERQQGVFGYIFIYSPSPGLGFYLLVVVDSHSLKGKLDWSPYPHAPMLQIC